MEPVCCGGSLGVRSGFVAGSFGVCLGFVFWRWGCVLLELLGSFQRFLFSGNDSNRSAICRDRHPAWHYQTADG
jgi:hypothetical protein